MKEITLGSIAAIIASLAFAVLVIYLIKVLITLNQTLKIIKIHVEPIASDASGIASSTKELVSDITSKVVRLDPVVQAASDLGDTVSHFTSKINKKEDKDKNESFNKTVVDLAQTAIKSGAVVSVAKAAAKRAIKRTSKNKK
jgi:uncharacterized protein YoxC